MFLETIINVNKLSNGLKNKEGIVLDYELVKINDNKSHSFYTVTSLDAFAKMLDTEWAREWDKANNCKDVVYKIDLVE